MLIAIIEDEEDLLELLEFNLQKEGFEVIGFLNPKKIREFLEEEDPDLLIVDRNLPFLEGSVLVRELREEGYNTPVIFLTAKNSEENVLEGFEAGGDDYITKPFNMKELIARVKAVLKRHNKTDFINHKNLKLDLNNKKLFYKHKEIQLTPSEFRLLKLFFENPKRTITKDEISTELDISEKSVNVAVNRLNHKIDIIEAIRGIGYRLK